ncbi:hypothetical protein ACA910_013981 [Epithemia clementina (nom. ined.)]
MEEGTPPKNETNNEVVLVIGDVNDSTSSSSSEMNNKDNTMDLIREGNTLPTPNANPTHLKKQDQPKAFWPTEEDVANVHLKNRPIPCTLVAAQRQWSPVKQQQRQQIRGFYPVHGTLLQRKQQ